jgi:pyruvate decarboxylase
MIPSESLKTPLTLESIQKGLAEPKVSEKVQTSIIKQITGMYEKAKKPIILVDACCIRYGVQKLTQELIEKTGMVRLSNLS